MTADLSVYRSVLTNAVKAVASMDRVGPALLAGNYQAALLHVDMALEAQRQVNIGTLLVAETEGHLDENVARAALQEGEDAEATIQSLKAVIEYMLGG